MALYSLVSLSLLLSAFPFTVDIDSSDFVVSVSDFVSLLRLVSAFSAVCRIFLFFFSLISGPAQGKVVGATYFLVSTHPRSVVYRNWEPQGSLAAKGRETINLLDTVWRSPLHQLTPQGQTLKGMEVAAMALFIMATLLPESFGRIFRAISALAWRLVATGWQRLPQLPARQRPRAPTAQRRPAARTGPGRLERFVVLVQRRTLAWFQEQDLVGHMVGLSAALLFALHILSFYLGGGVLVLKRASQRVADGRWTPLINMVFRPQPVGGRKAVEEGHGGIDPLWTPPYRGPVPIMYLPLEPAHTIETWEALLEETKARFPWRSALMVTPLYLRDFYYPPEYTVRRPPPPPSSPSPPPTPSPVVSVVLRPPPTTTGPNAVDITAPLQAPLALVQPMELN
ncbi:hypothetical protein TWF102_009423 [Orbilia oligospora]|uniref:Uncharacterized protein n=1 Tax=Orbilia oligospora TaxID=2813651 RepID=A0A7C8J6J3_ORBOL|nr:hypothetical protein TWF102_009423 [Orbilia oligospora]